MPGEGGRHPKMPLRVPHSCPDPQEEGEQCTALVEDAQQCPYRSHCSPGGTRPPWRSHAGWGGGTQSVPVSHRQPSCWADVGQGGLSAGAGTRGAAELVVAVGRADRLWRKTDES